MVQWLVFKHNGSLYQRLTNPIYYPFSMAPIITRLSSEESSTQDGFSEEHIPLGEYLFLRIHQANPQLGSIFGIPGDFNLPLLEHLYHDSVAANMTFIGVCNELNAAYAADGYAKITQGLSTLITTFGVGELSALNGIAGAFAEYAPVLHIVGTTSTIQASQAQGAHVSSVRNIHHLVQNKNALAAPNHDVYKSIVEPISVAQESLDTDGGLNLEKIDRVLTTIIHERRPGYLFIPSDVSDMEVPKTRLAQPLDLSELNNEALLADLVRRILHKLYVSETPSLMGDALADRFGAQDALDSFVEAMPRNLVKLFTTPMGRNIDETLPNYVGVYSGQLSSGPEVIEALERHTDFLLTLGHCNNEINTGRYSTNYSHIAEYVEVHPDYILIDGEYVNIKNHQTGQREFSIVDLMERLVSDFNPTRLAHIHDQVESITFKSEPKRLSLSEDAATNTITQNQLIDFFNVYLKPHDILIVETCSFLFGVSDMRFPKGVKLIAQNLYASIGYAIPATFGISRGERDLGCKRRVILIQGDGAAQMTMQEWSSYLRYDIQTPEIFLLNNGGYAVERIIKGPTRSYNDIQDAWQWTELFKAFGDTKGEKHEAERVNTTSDLKRLIGRPAISKMRFYELKLAKLDVPQRCKSLFG
ncbi:hypothetical protein JCM33374_g6112 [Metschnikowia sp. JCM 33374]|nr:hypothetical protein JCM33374_g6112 [Metschnikowia sp. JCM 33374]